MRLLRTIIYTTLILAGVCVHGQNVEADSVFSDTIIDESAQFSISRSILSEGSRERLRRFAGQVDSIISEDCLIRLSVSGSASPDGPEALNRRLSQQRAAAVRDFLVNESGLMPRTFAMSAKGEDWSLFRSLVAADEAVPSRGRVLEIIDGPDTPARKELALRRLDGGVPWRYIRLNVLPKVRVAVVTATYRNSRPTVAVIPAFGEEPADTVTAHELPTVPEEQPTPAPVPVAEPWQRHVYVKTNMPAWAMLWTNIAGECDIAPHWSVNLAIYYSGWNYFRGHTKFRTFAVMPEVRYWLRGANDGFYVQAHPGMVFYNVAFGGQNRYQDHRGRTPALGGGIGAGYRFALPRNPRWKFEFSLGAGIYRLDYDVFVNHVDGLQTDRRKRTFYGLDQLGASVCYTFDINPKGGGR